MMTMMTKVVLQLPPKTKIVKVEVIPPWIWHPYVGIDGTKEVTKPKEWFDCFFWRVVIGGKSHIVTKEEIDNLPETVRKIEKLMETER